MPNLILGVVDIPYAPDGAPPPRKAKKPKRGKAGKAAKVAKPKTPAVTTEGQTTTLQVAQILEAKYGVMRAFYDQYADPITGAVVHSMEGALESLFAGGPLGDPYAEAGQEIAAGFRQFLMSGEIEQMGIEGVPTQASLDRRSLRFKGKKAKGPRPSFVDTSTYELAFRSWVD